MEGKVQPSRRCAVGSMHWEDRSGFLSIEQGFASAPVRIWRFLLTLQSWREARQAGVLAQCSVCSSLKKILTGGVRDQCKTSSCKLHLDAFRHFQSHSDLLWNLYFHSRNWAGSMLCPYRIAKTFPSWYWWNVFVHHLSDLVFCLCYLFSVMEDRQHLPTWSGVSHEQCVELEESSLAEGGSLCSKEHSWACLHMNPKHFGRKWSF